MCSGFREAIVRRSFDYLSLCFCDWESAKAILKSEYACKSSAKVVFSHEGKLNAIIDVARRINDAGFARIRELIIADPLRELRQFPYIGDVTVWHLAKNLGLDVAKPDRHLVRISAQLGFSCADHLCSTIAVANEEQVKVVDLIIWRFLASKSAAPPRLRSNRRKGDTKPAGALGEVLRP